MLADNSKLYQLINIIGNVYSFTLSAFDLNAIFNAGSFIGSVAVDATNQPTISNVVGDTVVSVANGGGPTGIFDFRFDLTGLQQTRLTANESVSWNATFTASYIVCGLICVTCSGLNTRARR
jgi:hypothetical protein